MTAIEYIQLTSYKKYRGSVPVVDTGFTPFKLDNELYCTGRIKVNDIFYCFIRTNLDGRIIEGLPNAVSKLIEYRKEIYDLWKRIDKFFSRMIENAEQSNPLTELVKLRIIVNLIYNLPIAKEERLQWADWIKELYWNRKALLNKWYIENVLPF